MVAALELVAHTGDNRGMHDVPSSTSTAPVTPNHEVAGPIAVVGGGISGLSAAHRLTELLPEAKIHVLEATPHVGGVLQTVRDGDYLIEASADNFITKLPWAEALCDRLGLGDDLLPTEGSRRKALVVNRGKIQPVPEAFVLMSAGRLLPILKSPTLSFTGKLRLLLEPFVSKRSAQSDESVASFSRRRLGVEAYERLVQPLVAGIYTADPEKLSMQAAMPKFFEQEQQSGSLWRARQSTGGSESGARYSSFVAPRLGVRQLVEALANRLPADSLRCNAPVETVAPDDRQWLATMADGSSTRYESVLLATPTSHVASSVWAFDRTLAEQLRTIEYSSVSIVVLSVPKRNIAKPLIGFGFVVPQIERRQIIAASFASLKFPGRAPDDHVLIRVFIGGALQPELAELADQQLVGIARDELADLVGLTGEPALERVFRWPRSMPQYHLGHVSLVEQIEQRVATHAGLELAGNAYHGVGIPQCVHSGESAAERVAAHLTKHAGTSGS